MRVRLPTGWPERPALPALRAWMKRSPSALREGFGPPMLAEEVRGTSRYATLSRRRDRMGAFRERHALHRTISNRSGPSVSEFEKLGFGLAVGLMEPRSPLAAWAAVLASREPNRGATTGSACARSHATRSGAGAVCGSWKDPDPVAASFIGAITAPTSDRACHHSIRLVIRLHDLTRFKLHAGTASPPDGRLTTRRALRRSGGRGLDAIGQPLGP